MFCPECGTKVPDNSKFCFSCGYKMEGLLSQSSDNQSSPSDDLTQSESDKTGKEESTNDVKVRKYEVMGAMATIDEQYFAYKPIVDEIAYPTFEEIRKRFNIHKLQQEEMDCLDMIGVFQEWYEPIREKLVNKCFGLFEKYDIYTIDFASFDRFVGHSGDDYSADLSSIGSVPVYKKEAYRLPLGQAQIKALEVCDEIIEDTIAYINDESKRDLIISERLESRYQFCERFRGNYRSDYVKKEWERRERNRVVLRNILDGVVPKEKVPQLICEMIEKDPLWSEIYETIAFYDLDQYVNVKSLITDLGITIDVDGIADRLYFESKQHKDLINITNKYNGIQNVNAKILADIIDKQRISYEYGENVFRKLDCWDKRESAEEQLGAASVAKFKAIQPLRLNNKLGIEMAKTVDVDSLDIALKGKKITEKVLDRFQVLPKEISETGNMAGAVEKLIKDLKDIDPEELIIKQLLADVSKMVDTSDKIKSQNKLAKLFNEIFKSHNYGEDCSFHDGETKADDDSLFVYFGDINSTYARHYFIVTQNKLVDEYLKSINDKVFRYEIDLDDVESIEYKGGLVIKEIIVRTPNCFSQEHAFSVDALKNGEDFVNKLNQFVAERKKVLKELPADERTKRIRQLKRVDLASFCAHKREAIAESVKKSYERNLSKKFTKPEYGDGVADAFRQGWDEAKYDSVMLNYGKPITTKLDVVRSVFALRPEENVYYIGIANIGSTKINPKTYGIALVDGYLVVKNNKGVIRRAFLGGYEDIFKKPTEGSMYVAGERFSVTCGKEVEAFIRQIQDDVKKMFIEYADKVAPISDEQVDEEHHKENAIQNDNVVICAKCGNSIQKTERFCRKCGTSNPLMGEDINSSKNDRVDDGSKMYFCRKCGEKISAQTKFCTKCGEKNFYFGKQ